MRRSELHTLPGMLGHLIVYVEDNEDDIFFVAKALEQARHRGQFLAFKTVGAAKEYFRTAKETPGLILVDLHIGADSGRDLIEFLRALPSFRNVPIVTVSATYRYDDLDKAYETGANLFLAKPRTAKAWTDTLLKLRDYFPLR